MLIKPALVFLAWVIVWSIANLVVCVFHAMTIFHRDGTVSFLDPYLTELALFFLTWVIVWSLALLAVCVFHAINS